MVAFFLSMLPYQEEQRQLLVDCCPYLDDVIPRERHTLPPAGKPQHAAPLDGISMSVDSADVIEL